MCKSVVTVSILYKTNEINRNLRLWINVCLVVDKNLSHRNMVFLCCQMEGSEAILSRAVHISFMFCQQCHHVRVAFLGSQVQWSEAVLKWCRQTGIWNALIMNNIIEVGLSGSRHPSLAEDLFALLHGKPRSFTNQTLTGSFTNQILTGSLTNQTLTGSFTNQTLHSATQKLCCGWSNCLQ